MNHIQSVKGTNGDVWVLLFFARSFLVHLYKIFAYKGNNLF